MLAVEWVRPRHVEIWCFSSSSSWTCQWQSQSHHVRGLHGNGDGRNTTVTMMTACCSCMDWQDCKLCSIGLEMDQNRSFLSRIVLICSLLTFTSVSLRGWGGDGDRSDGEGWRWVQRSREWGSVYVPIQTSTSCVTEILTWQTSSFIYAFYACTLISSVHVKNYCNYHNYQKPAASMCFDESCKECS